jgi:hypothetical protein
MRASRGLGDDAAMDVVRTPWNGAMRAAAAVPAAGYIAYVFADGARCGGWHAIIMAIFLSMYAVPICGVALVAGAAAVAIIGPQRFAVRGWFAICGSVALGLATFAFAFVSTQGPRFCVVSM